MRVAIASLFLSLALGAESIAVFFSLLDLLAVVLCAVNVKCSFEGVKKAMHRDKLIVFEIKYNVRDNESRESARTALVPNLSIERGSRPCACVHLSENKRAE